MNASIRILVAIAMATLLCTMAWAQGETGQITGVVTDPSGAVVPNAKVTARIQTTGAERTAVTTESGVYAITNLPPGAYTLTVAASGFSTVQRPAMLSVGARVGADFRLEVGRSETVIQVTETAGNVNTETQTVGTVINSTQLMELPSLTRNPYDFVSTAGNVTPTSDLGSSPRGVNYAINGQRSTSVNIQLDGASNNNDFYTGVGQRVPLDAVAEYSLLTSDFTAEVGRAGGGVVNVITKSGTNELHGGAYVFNRVSKLASNDFNNNANEIPRENFTRNQFGYSIGGPIKKDKLFFFNSVEWTRVRSALSSIKYAPTPQLIAASAATTRDFFSTYGTIRSGATVLGTFSRNQLIANEFDPCSGTLAGGPCKSLNADMPMFTRYQYLVPGDSGAGFPQNAYQLVGRADYNLSPKTQIYGRWVIDKEVDFDGAQSESVYSGYDTPNENNSNGVSLSLTRTVSPTVVAQSRLSFTRLTNQQPLGAVPASPTLYFYRNQGTVILGDYMDLPGYLPNSPGVGIPGGSAQNTFNYQQDLSVVKGKHQLRFGGSYTYIQDNEMFAAYLNPVETLSPGGFGAGMDNLLRGVLSRYQTAVDPQGKYPCNGAVTPQCSVIKPVGSPDFTRSNRYHEFAFYGQDSWRIGRNLTLNLGLRWEYFGVQHNKNPLLDSNFYDGGGGSYAASLRNGNVAIAEQSVIKGLWAKDWNNFAPRLGFAWDVFGNGKTSFRGGYGLGYERNFGNVTFNVIQNPPGYAVMTIQSLIDVNYEVPISTDLRGPLAGTSGSAALYPTSLRNVDMNIKTAYAHFWSVALEHQFTPSLVLAAEYTGSKGVKLYSLENPNSVGSGNVRLDDPCDVGDPFSCTARLLQSKGYTDINRRGNNGFSNYHGLNVKATINSLSRAGLQFTVNYTLSHAIDNMSTTFSEYNNDFNLGLLDPFNPKLDKGSASFDARHRISIGGIWEIPFAKNATGIARHILYGWQLAPIVTARTGSPFSIYDSTNTYYWYVPRAMFDAAVPTGAPATLVATTTPNTVKWLDMSNPAYQINSSWVNPITGTSEFGPFPQNMTGRNSFYGPGSFNMDLGIYKNFTVSERFKAQFRFESYNTLNHANLLVNTSGVDFWSTNFVTAGYTGRRNVQLALKLSF